jgi:hypothetical protein
MFSLLNHSIHLLNRQHRRQNVAQDVVAVTMVAHHQNLVSAATIADTQSHRVVQVWVRVLLEVNHLVVLLNQQSRFNLADLNHRQSLDIFNERRAN